jgi:hypothetical protein
MEEQETRRTLTALVYGGLITLVVALFAFGGVPGQWSGSTIEPPVLLAHP